VEKVAREEIGQWLLEILSFCQEYDGITSRITGSGEGGPGEYRGALAEGELPALLDRLRRMSVPPDAQCQSITKYLEDGISARIRAEAVTAEFAGSSYDKNLSASRALWLSASRTCLDNMIKGLALLRERYKI